MTPPAPRGVQCRTLTWLVVAALLAGCLVGVAVPAGTGWDFANFYDTGRRAAAGQIDDIYDPTTLIAGEPPHGPMQFWGAPISAYFYAPMSLFQPRTALVLFKMQNIAAFAGTFGLLWLFNRQFRPDRAADLWCFGALFLFLCLIFQPFWTVFRVGGQTTPTALLLLTGALLAHVHARFRVAAACVTLAVLIKPAMAWVLIYLSVAAGPVFFLPVSALLALVGLLSIAWLGWPLHEQFIARMIGNVQAIYPWESNSSLFVLVGSLQSYAAATDQGPLGRWLATTLGVAMKSAVLVTFVVLARRGRRRSWPAAARRHFDVLMAVLFFLLWSSTLWEHYLELLFLPLVYWVTMRHGLSRRAQILIWAIIAFAATQNLILIRFLHDALAIDSLSGLVAISLFKSAPLLLTLLFLWRHSGEWFDSYALPIWRGLSPAAHEDA